MDIRIPTADELNAMSAPEHKIYENRLRRMAARQGLALQKSRRRDPRALDYGAYWLVQVTDAGVGWRSRPLVSPEHGMSLDEVARYLTGDGEVQP